MYLLRVLSLIQELGLIVSVSISMSGSGAVDLRVGSYTRGVYMPLKALFLVLQVKRFNQGVHKSKGSCPTNSIGHIEV